MAMKALFLNSKLKKLPRVLNTQTAVDRPAAVFKEPDIKNQVIRIKNYNIAFGTFSDKGKKEKYPHGRIKICNIPVTAIFIGFGMLFSIAKKTIERQHRPCTGICSGTEQYHFYGKAGGNITTEIESCMCDKSRMCDIRYTGHKLTYFSKLFKKGSLRRNLRKLTMGTKRVSGWG